MNLVVCWWASPHHSIYQFWSLLVMPSHLCQSTVPSLPQIQRNLSAHFQSRHLHLRLENTHHPTNVLPLRRCSSPPSPASLEKPLASHEVPFVDHRRGRSSRAFFKPWSVWNFSWVSPWHELLNCSRCIKRYSALLVTRSICREVSFFLILRAAHISNFIHSDFATLRSSHASNL